MQLFDVLAGPGARLVLEHSRQVKPEHLATCLAHRIAGQDSGCAGSSRHIEEGRAGSFRQSFGLWSVQGRHRASGGKEKGKVKLCFPQVGLGLSARSVYLCTGARYDDLHGSGSDANLLQL